MFDKLSHLWQRRISANQRTHDISRPFTENSTAITQQLPKTSQHSQPCFHDTSPIFSSLPTTSPRHFHDSFPRASRDSPHCFHDIRSTLLRHSHEMFSKLSRAFPHIALLYAHIHASSSQSSKSSKPASIVPRLGCSRRYLVNNSDRCRQSS